MSGDVIVRLAARGDGVTEGGAHIAGAVPGDSVTADGSLVRGPHHVTPPCRHFARCGGCQLQHCDEEVLARFVTDRVTHAAAQHGLQAETLLPAHLSPPESRRRVTLHAINGGGRPLIGFREAGSHKLVDLAECPVMRPELFALVGPLRDLLKLWGGRYAVDIDLAIVDQGVACDIRKLRYEGLEQTQALIDFAGAQALARLTVDQEYGPETQWEPDPVTVTLGGVPVAFPVGGFLQATADGEAALVGAARDWVEEGPVADLFSGLGTFALALADRGPVTAFEASRDASQACRIAAAKAQLPVTAQHRDLFRAPLQPDELASYRAVVLDPPRAGAREQSQQLATSPVQQIVYISCNPQSWARDAATLVAGGYRLKALKPVGQFRWSTHVELASLFERPA